MAAGTDLVVATPGNGQGPLDLNIGHPLAIVIGGNCHLMAQLLQRTRLFQDADVTAIISKKAGRRDHQHAVRLCRRTTRPWH